MPVSAVTSRFGAGFKSFLKGHACRQIQVRASGKIMSTSSCEHGRCLGLVNNSWMLSDIALSRDSMLALIACGLPSIMFLACTKKHL